MRRLIALAALSALPGCGPDMAFFRLAGTTMGTAYAVDAAGGRDCSPALSHLVEAELKSVDAQMSTWRTDSELSRFNAAPAGTPVPVSAELAHVVSVAQELARQSDGAFDVTVGPLVDLWGFGVRDRQGVPSDEEIAAAVRAVGFRSLEVAREPPALRKWVDGLRIDLSAIAKGHGVDRLATLFDSAGCTDYLIDIGGEVRVRGRNPERVPWRIGVEIPGEGRSGLVLGLSDAAVATSGDYRNFRLVDGALFSHTIDPRTGRPVAHDMASVTVLADTATRADGLATLINVLGPEDGLAFAERRGLAVLALVRREGGLDRRYTAAMRDRIENLP